MKRYREEFLAVAESHGVTDPETSDVASDLATKFSKLVYNPEHMLHSDYPNLVKGYPAHLHIDILASHQSQGWGEKMINVLLEKLKDAGISGVHLGMVADNKRAGKFYDRIAFERFSEMSDNGELGRQGNSLYRVKKVA